MPKFMIVTRDEDGDWYLDQIVPANRVPETGETLPAWPSFTTERAKAMLIDTEEHAVNLLGVVKSLGSLAWVREALPTTLKEAKAYAREFGCSLTKRDGEYRVCPLGSPEAQAYYTDSLTDALLTGKTMTTRPGA